MILFPAIDIKDGKVVRLRQGQFSQESEYSQDPLSMAKHWVQQGAEWLHVVDLDGAQTGEMKNLSIIVDMAQKIKVPIQVGGGIRSLEIIEKLIQSGIKRVVLGTKAIEDQAFLKSALKKFKDQLAVSIDCQNGMAAQRGWTSVSNVKGTDLAKNLEKAGVKYLIYTDIARDGMLSGPNFDGLAEFLKATTLPVIASGGIANLNDIKKLKKFVPSGLLGAITGKALYEGQLDLKEALALCSKNE